MNSNNCSACGGTGLFESWTPHCQKNERCPICMGSGITFSASSPTYPTTGQRGPKRRPTIEENRRNQRDVFAFVIAVAVTAVLVTRPTIDLTIGVGILAFLATYIVALIVLKTNPWIMRLVGKVVKFLAYLMLAAAVVWILSLLLAN